MTNITDVTTANWQMSVSGIGNIEQGANDVNQCIAILLATQKGSDPLRQDFGVDLLKWIDQPTNIMAPGLVNEIIEQITAYETRVNISAVKYSTPDQRAIFGITWAYKDGIAPQGYTYQSTAGNTVYLALTTETGFILLNDFDVAIILN